MNLEDVSQKTNEQGQLTFDDLTIGIYLIVPIESSRYGTIQSSLVEIPMQEDGKLFMMSKSIQKLNLFQQKLKMTMMNL